jgi:hypothetical protein
MDNMAKFDHDQDGKLSEKEFALYKENETLKADLAKQNDQSNMAWTAIMTMIGFTILLFMPFIDVDRVAALADMIDLFYLAQAGIVGAFMGATAWMKRK